MLNILAQILDGPLPKPPRVLLYGTEGVGKTTFASKAPRPLFLDTEDGLGQIAARRLPITSWSTLPAALDAILRHKESICDTLVIDSLDAAERMLHRHICEQRNVATIDHVDGGYGKGYTLAAAEWHRMLQQLDALRQRGILILLIAHSTIVRFEDPEHPAYDRYQPRLHKTVTAMTCEWCDVVAFAHQPITVIADNSRARAKTQQQRALRVCGGAACIAKNRYGLTADLPLEWSAFQKAIRYEPADAVSASR